MPIQPLHLGYVVKRYPRYSETFIVNEILAHEAAGVNVDIFALRPPSDTHFQDVISRVRAPVHYMPAGPLRAADFWRETVSCSAAFPVTWQALKEASDQEALDIYQGLRLAKLAAATGINHLHAHFATVATTVARLASCFSGIPYSFTAHAKDIYHESVDAQQMQRKLEDASSVITISDFNLDYMLHMFGSSGANIHHVYNGLDVEQFRWDDPYARPNRIVAVGRLVEKKGFAILIDACAILAERGRAFDCQIIGAGELEPDLLAQIRHLGLQEQVALLGPRPQAEVFAAIQEAAAFVLPCIVGEDGNRDGLPTVLLEAMALGTPCVSTAVTGIPEVLWNHETGLLVRQGDPADLADVMELLLSDPDLRSRLATNARRLIETKFDIHANTAQLRSIFNSGAQEELAFHGVG